MRKHPPRAPRDSRDFSHLERYPGGGHPNELSREMEKGRLRRTDPRPAPKDRPIQAVFSTTSPGVECSRWAPPCKTWVAELAFSPPTVIRAGPDDNKSGSPTLVGFHSYAWDQAIGAWASRSRKRSCSSATDWKLCRQGSPRFGLRPGLPGQRCTGSGFRAGENTAEWPISDRLET